MKVVRCPADPDETAEAYLLGRLSQQQREVFEDHVISCPLCTASACSSRRTHKSGAPRRRAIAGQSYDCRCLAGICRFALVELHDLDAERRARRFDLAEDQNPPPSYSPLL